VESLGRRGDVRSFSEASGAVDEEMLLCGYRSFWCLWIVGKMWRL